MGADKDYTVVRDAMGTYRTTAHNLWMIHKTLHLTCGIHQARN